MGETNVSRFVIGFSGDNFVGVGNSWLKFFFSCYSILFVMTHYALNPVVFALRYFSCASCSSCTTLGCEVEYTSLVVSRSHGSRYSQGSTCEVSKSGANPRGGRICWWLGYLCLDPRGWWLVTVSFYVFCLFVCHLLVLKKSLQVATRWPAAQVAGWADAWF